jgi:ribokinase
LLGTDSIDSDSADAAASTLQTRGPRFVIITLGTDGAVLATADGTEQVPAFAVDPVDTTAAGDTFCGAFAAALARGDELAKAVRFGSAAAALSVTRLGAQPSIPTRAEVVRFLAARG